MIVAPDAVQRWSFRRPTWIATLLTLAITTTVAGAAHDAAAQTKPKFASKLITPQAKGHSVEIDVEITGAKELYLVVTDGGDGFGCDWADWAEPRFVTAAGETKLTDLSWRNASSEWGQVRKNKNAGGGALKIDGKEVAYGIGTHANSVIFFDVPAGATRFKARAGLDNGGTDQGGGSTVEFLVFTEKPPKELLAKRGGGGGNAGGNSDQRNPENAVAGLDVYDGLEATLFASEPMLANPTNIDIDHRGRVWVCDVANYRGHKGERPDGDRILILEDTNGDGKADKSTVFYQGKDLLSPQGICVLGNKVIVSASPNVWVFTDENGDDKPEKKEALFTSTGDAQHDHSVHSFVFGPDGKLYFNMGNAGSKVCDKNGNVIVDKAGNRVENNGKPYRQGMVFRCNLDGGEFETLAWNFRNNYEVCVDSFGNIWQSDNDDDGNKAVRINYVMEGGNYGFTDEMTGAGWQSPRTNMEKDIPSRHWHLNDPGVVPNVLITGAGAPSGITVYEGGLLPKPFQGQILHCDPGVNVMRCYRVEKDGAGFKHVETVDILKGARDNWFRPADVCVAPDGSLFVSDWYDPGVGGHAQGDTSRGRIFRVAPKGAAYRPGVTEAKKPADAVNALKSPCQAVRYLAWQTFDAATPEMKKVLLGAVDVAADEILGNPEKVAHTSQRALLARYAQLYIIGMPDRLIGEGQRLRFIATILQGKQDELITCVWQAARIAGKVNAADLAALISKQIAEQLPASTLRELTTLCRSDAQAATSWTELAMRYNGRDRWYLEALGISAANKWDACLDAWLEKVGDKWNSAAGRDIIWRSRAKKTPGYLAKIIIDPQTPTDELPRFLRAFDFQTGPEKNAALVQLAFAGISDVQRRKLVSTEALKRLGGGFDVNKDPRMQVALKAVLDDARGTSQFVELVGRFHIQTRYPDLLEIAQNNAEAQLGIEAMQTLLKTSEGPGLLEALVSNKLPEAIATATALGSVANKESAEMLLRTISDESRHVELRKAAARGLAKTKRGAEELLKLLKSEMIPLEVGSGAAFALHAAPWPEVRLEAGKLFPPPPTKNNKPLPPISELVGAKGDAARGKAVFAAAGTCAKCHVVGKEGKDVGPSLSEIGDKLSRQALYESILFPSSGIAHGFEVYTVRLEDGNVVTGLLLSRTAEGIAIKGEDALVRTFKTDEVEEVKKQSISMMPADLQKLMTMEELADVVEYLTTLKKAAGK